MQMDILYDTETVNWEDIGSEEATYLLNTVDPYETNQISFSEIVKLFTTHPARQEKAISEAGGDQISILEKFVTKAIEDEESQKRIMVKLEERINEETKHEQNTQNGDDNYDTNSRRGQNHFENFDNQEYDDLKEEYELYDHDAEGENEGQHPQTSPHEHHDKEDGQYQRPPDSEEPMSPEEQELKDSHALLAHSLDPVEEVEEGSVRHSLNKRGSVENQTDENVEQEEIHEGEYYEEEGEHYEDEGEHYEGEGEYQNEGESPQQELYEDNSEDQQ